MIIIVFFIFLLYFLSQRILIGDFNVTFENGMILMNDSDAQQFRKDCNDLYTYYDQPTNFGVSFNITTIRIETDSSHHGSMDGQCGDMNYNIADD